MKEKEMPKIIVREDRVEVIHGDGSIDSYNRIPAIICRPDGYIVIER